jgi:hypothetical protein
MQIDAEIPQKIGQSCYDKIGSRVFSKASSPCFRTVLSMSFIFFLLELLALKINQVGTVPVPALKLQDFKYIKPSKLQLQFRPCRKYPASTHYIHVRVPFNFTKLLGMPDQIMPSMTNISESGLNLSKHK